MRAAGKRACRSPTSGPGRSPNRMAQTPLSPDGNQDGSQRTAADGILDLNTSIDCGFHRRSSSSDSLDSAIVRTGHCGHSNSALSQAHLPSGIAVIRWKKVMFCHPTDIERAAYTMFSEAPNRCARRAVYAACIELKRQRIPLAWTPAPICRPSQCGMPQDREGGCGCRETTDIAAASYLHTAGFLPGAASPFRLSLS